MSSASVTSTLGGSTPARSSHSVSALVLFLVLLGAVALSWLTLPRSGQADTAVMALIWVNTTVLIAALALEARRRPYSLHLMHLLAMSLFVGAASIFQYSTGRLALAGPIAPLQSQIQVGVVAVSLWILGYLAGYELHRRLGRRHGGSVSAFLCRPVTLIRAHVFMMLAIVSLLYLAAIGLAGVGTRGAATEAMIEHTLATGTGALGLGYHLIHSMLLRAFSPVAVLVGMVVLVRLPRSRTPIFIGLVAATLIGTLVGNNPFAAARMWLSTTLIAFSAALFLKRMQTGWLLVLITLAGVALLPALHETRFMLSFDEVIEFFELSSPVVYLTTSSDVDSLGMLALVQRWTEIHGYTWGKQILAGILFWVPRTIWPTKPIETGAQVTGDLGFEFTNLSPPVMAEALVGFGLLGVLPAAAIFGTILSRLDQTYWYAQAPDGRLRVIDCFFPFWLGCVVFITRGGWFASIGFTSVFSFWILLLALGMSRRTRRGGRTDSPERMAPAADSASQGTPRAGVG